MSAPFKMTPELMDQVIFGMENQKDKMVLDSETGLVVPTSTLTEEELQGEQYYQLPSWEPADGFQLMEGFCRGPAESHIQGEAQADTECRARCFQRI